MKQLYLLLSCLLLSTVLSAQHVSGIVVNAEGVPLSNSTVSLLKGRDSSVQKLSVTKDGGQFSFLLNNKENYIIAASYTGYKTAYSKPVNLTTNELKDIRLVLLKSSLDLQKVTVTAKRPMLEVKADKMVMNVEGTINAAGSDAFELLRKAPAVSIDNDDNIILSGKTGTQIFIDGKPSPLAGGDLSSYLKSIQAAQIESIEIITNPSSKYEAAGNAGIINIRLKKNKSFGTNGSVNAGYGIGVFSKYNTGFSLNYRKRKVNLFSTYSYSNVINEINTTAYRIQQDTIFDQSFGRFIHDKGHNIKAGIDYFLNKATTLGVIITAAPGEQQMDEPGVTAISYAATGKLDKTLVATTINDTKRSNSNINLNYRFEQKDKELNVDVDYGKYSLSNDRLQPNNYYDVSNNYLFGRTYNMLTPTNINLASFKMNNVRNFSGGKLDIGGKTSYVRSENNFQRFDVINNGRRFDSLHSNSFEYRENINALYVNYNKEYKKILWQVGMRMENTIITGHSNGFELKNNFAPFDSSFKKNYTDLFPAVALTWKKNSDNQIGLAYSKRVDRPIYQNLNPFEYKLDEYTSRKGNTNLQPQYTNSISISYTYKSKLSAILNYSSIRSMFAQLFDTAERTKSFISITNIGKQDLVNLNLNYIIQAKRFSGFFNLNSFYAHSTADFGTDRTIDLSSVSVTLRSQQSWQFAKTYTAELVEYYSSPYIWEGTFKIKSMGSVDAGLQKTMLEGRATLKASVTDIFYTMQARLSNNFAGQNQTLWRAWEPHLFRINATYRFGSNQVKGSRQRKTGLEEESKRVQSGS